MITIIQYLSPSASFSRALRVAILFVLAYTPSILRAEDDVVEEFTESVVVENGYSEAPDVSEPSWLSRSSKPEEHEKPASHGHALRSFGALFVVIALLLGGNYWVRKRFTPGVSSVHSALRVQSRLSVGPRQEVIVVEWEGDQLMLGVGQSFIQPLHIRRASDVQATPQNAEVEYAQG